VEIKKGEGDSLGKLGDLFSNIPEWHLSFQRVEWPHCSSQRMLLKGRKQALNLSRTGALVPHSAMSGFWAGSHTSRIACLNPSQPQVPQGLPLSEIEGRDHATRHSTPVKPRLTSQQSTNPFRLLSLHRLYVHIVFQKLFSSAGGPHLAHCSLSSIL